MTRIVAALAVAALCTGLSGCLVGTVVSTAADVTGTAISTTADVAGAAIDTVTPDGDGDCGDDKDC